jgi:hypothetical protein
MSTSSSSTGSSSSASGLAAWTSKRAGSSSGSSGNSSSGGSSKSSRSSGSSGGSSSSSSDSTDTSAMSSSVDTSSDETMSEPPMSDAAAEYNATDARLASIAARHVRPEHIEKVLTAHAYNIQHAIKKKRMTPAQVDAMSDADHEDAIRRLAETQPSILRPKPGRPQLKSVPKPRY